MHILNATFLADSPSSYASALPSGAYPFYHLARPSIIPNFADRYLSVLSPFVVYWAVSLVFAVLDWLAPKWPALERHRIHESGEVQSKNRVTPGQVVRAVVLQQVIQTALGLAWLEDDDPLKGPFRDHGADLARYAVLTSKAVTAVLGKSVGGQLLRTSGRDLAAWTYWWGVPIAQFVFAAFCLDGWQYAWHRYFHTNRFLYRHVHSVHHRLYVPYAFGALYNHPVEGFVLDTLGAVVAQTCARMTIRQSILFFIISTAKTVDDHGGYNFKWDPFQLLFANDVDYHDIHHQTAGLKKNFSQPYFIHFDHFFGTRMTRAEFEAKRYKRRKGLEAPPENKVNGPNELAAPPTSRRNGMALKEE